MVAEIELVVRKFIADNFIFRDSGKAISNTDSLLEAGLIDSTGILELVGFLEKTFEIRVADAEVVPENLDSIHRIATYVDRKIKQKTANEGSVCHAR